MKKNFLLLFIAAQLISSSLAFCSTPPPISSLQAQANELVHSLQAAELWIGGAVAVSNGIDTKVSLYGVKDPSNKIPPSGVSHFEIGSISKSFTGILLAWVINQNPQIHLDDPIKNFIPELKGYFTGGMTLRGLATHTSGINADFCIQESTPNQKCYLNPVDPSNPWVDFSESELLDFLKAFTQSDTVPAHTYSNPGFITLGYALSKITGKSYERMLEEVITGPLQMTDTFVNQPGLSIGDYIQGYNVIDLPENHWQFNLLSAPTGGIISTPNDMAKYLQANLAPSSSVLGQAMTFSQKNGLGWDSLPGDSISWKNGGTAGFSSYIMVDPKNQQGWFAISNLSSDYSGDYFPNFAIFGGNRPDIFGVTLSDSVLNTFVGTYSSPDQSGDVLITKPGHFLRFNGGDDTSDFRLQALSSVDFATTDNEHYIGYDKLTFQSDSSGNVTGFIFHLNDGKGNYRDYSFKKMN